jgi:glutathione S-transferase
MSTASSITAIMAAAPAAGDEPAAAGPEPACGYSSPMRATLYVLPGSHPSTAARMMLEAKGIEYRRVDLIFILAKGILRLAGFPGVTVPALKIDGRKVQGTRAIVRALEEIQPEPPLLPADPERRAAVEEAERWGDEVLQPIARRITWNVLWRDPRGRRSYLEGARLGLPISVATMTAAPFVYLSKRFNQADDEAVRRDVAELPEAVEKVDGLLAGGVIGGERLNAADFQIATSLRLLMTLDDVRPALAGHPAAEYAMRVCPEYPGYAPLALPAEWKRWERQVTAAA